MILLLEMYFCIKLLISSAMKISAKIWCISTLAILASLSATAQKYWQQKVDTRIDVTLDDQKHMLRGAIDIAYHNQSPDTLHFIYFHLYPNAYKSNQTAYAKQMSALGNASFAKTTPEERGFIDSLNFTVNQQKAGITYTTDIDVIKVLLPQPLLPNAQITITTPFRVKIPKTSSRLGHTDQSYQISQWFPKPAVYDQTGWHAFPYLNLGEYYSEFGCYNVNISVPDNYIVMATGNLNNSQENLWLDSLAQLPIDSLKTTTNTSSKTYKTLNFTEDNIHDFAWFADKNWIVRKSEFTIPENNQIVTAYACYFPDNKKGWQYSLDYIQNAIQGYSKYIGAYPYKTVKAVSGALEAGGGMEYPTITVIDPTNNPELTEQVIVHEVGHNWFYGVLGNNERDFPFMDEAINSYFEERIIRDNLKENVSQKVKLFSNLAYASLASADELTPLCSHSTAFKNLNYGIDVYLKGAKYFEWLQHYMGQTQFDAAMKAYFDEWKYKHPQPEDLQVILQKHTDKPINWFFEDAITNAMAPDFKVSKIKTNNAVPQLKITNINQINSPVALTLWQNKKLTDTIWTTPFKQSTVLQLPKGTTTAIIDQHLTPDYLSSNNSSCKKLRIRGFAGLNTKDAYSIWLAPSLGYNTSDGFMLGGLIHNLSAPFERLQYAFAPMYGFSSKQFVYTGFASYAQPIRNGVFKEAIYTLESKRFSTTERKPEADPSLHYTKIALTASLKFRPKNYATQTEQFLNIKLYNILNQYAQYRRDPADSNNYLRSVHNEDPQWFVKLQYVVSNQRKFNPFDAKITAILNKDAQKFTAEGTYKINYNASKKGVTIRGFMGIVMQSEANANAYNPAGLLSLSNSGWNDYLYDETYIGRFNNTGFASRQVSITEGGFYMTTPLYANAIGLSNSALFAVNLKVDIPKTPLAIFGNLGYTATTEDFNSDAEKVQYEAGIELNIAKGFTLAAPILLSKDFRDYRTFIVGKNAFFKTLAFRMDLGNINWGRAPLKLIAN